MKGAPRWPICLEKGGVPTAHKVEGCRLSVKARVADFPQSRDAVRRCPPWLQPSWEEGTGSRASRPRVLGACEPRPPAREGRVLSTDRNTSCQESIKRSPIFNFTLKKSYSQSTRRWPFFKFHAVRSRSPYRWWKERACISENNAWGKGLFSLNARIRFAIEDELKEVGNAGMDDRLRRVTFDPILFAMAKEQKRQRKADKVAQKKEIDELEGERHRLRVTADRWRLERGTVSTYTTWKGSAIIQGIPAGMQNMAVVVEGHRNGLLD